MLILSNWERKERNEYSCDKGLESLKTNRCHLFNKYEYFYDYLSPWLKILGFGII